MVSNLFFNVPEQRLRAGWRLVLHMALVALLVFSLNLALVHCPALVNLDLVWIVFLTILATNIGMLGGTLLCTRFLDRRPFRTLGLLIDRVWLKELAFGLGLGAFLMTAIFLTGLGLGYVHVTGYWRATNTDLPVLAALAINLVTFIQVGIYEETFSRGYQLSNLAQGFSRLTPVWSLPLATVLSSAVFGAMHLGNESATVVSTINVAVCGVMLAVPYLFTGRLGISIGLHIAWNFFQTCVFGFAVSGLTTTATVIQIQQLDSGWFTGGAFGPEAGVSGLLAMFLGMLLALIWVKRTNGGRLQLCSGITSYPPVPEKKAA